MPRCRRLHTACANSRTCGVQTSHHMCETCESEWREKRRRKIRGRNKRRAEHRMGANKRETVQERRGGGGESQPKHREELSKHRETNKERNEWEHQEESIPSCILLLCVSAASSILPHTRSFHQKLHEASCFYHFTTLEFLLIVPDPLCSKINPSLSLSVGDFLSAAPCLRLFFLSLLLNWRTFCDGFVRTCFVSSLPRALMRPLALQHGQYVQHSANKPTNLLQ